MPDALTVAKRRARKAKNQAVRGGLGSFPCEKSPHASYSWNAMVFDRMYPLSSALSPSSYGLCSEGRITDAHGSVSTIIAGVRVEASTFNMGFLLLARRSLVKSDFSNGAWIVNHRLAA
jgi:hypothetical protein